MSSPVFDGWVLFFIFSFQNSGFSDIIFLKSQKEGPVMEAITSLAVLEDRIRKAPILIAEFGTAGCGPCLALQKKLESWQSRHPCIPCLYIPLGGCPEICGQMGDLFGSGSAGLCAGKARHPGSRMLQPGRSIIKSRIL